MESIENRISLTKGSAITFASNVLTFILGLGASIIIARMLGPTNKGICTLIGLIPALLLKFGTLGMEASNVYFSGNRRYKLSDISSNSLSCGLSLGLILILIFWIISRTGVYQNFISSKGINPFYIWLVVFTIPFSLFSMFLNSILVGREKVMQYNGLNIFQSVFGLVLIVILMIWLKLGLFGAILLMIFSSLIGFISKTIFVNKVAKIKFSFNPQLLKESLKYGGKAYLGNCAQFLNYRLDMFLVAYFLTPAEVGYYSLAVGIAEELWLIPNSIATILFPRVSSVGEKEANNLTPKVSRHALFIISVLALGLLLLARPLIGLLYGTVYLPSAVPFMILLPGIVALGVSKIFSAYLAGRGRIEFGMIGAFISLPATLLLDLWLIPKWGIIGAAFASTVSYTLATLIVLIAFLKISGNSLLDTLIIKKQDIETYILPKLKGLKNAFAQIL